MPLTLISAKNLRNLHDYQLSPNPYNNVFIGKNGAGKTNLLEGIYLNALGRSFRTNLAPQIIQHHQESCLLFSRYKENAQATREHRLGFERNRSNKQAAHVDGEAVANLSQLAAIAPMVLIQPDETELIDGASSNRRKYIDMLMFHVEPSFLPLWRQHQHLLKQRNQLFKSNTSNIDTLRKNLEPWNKQFIRVNQVLQAQRQQVFSEVLEDVVHYLQQFEAFSKTTGAEIRLEFYQGWPKESLLEDVLERSLESERLRGFTLSGGHRAEIKIKSEAGLAKAYLSRGQKKLLTMLMRLAQARFLKRAGKEAVLLLDDIFAEMDEPNTRAFIEAAEALGLQSFYTSVQQPETIKKMFRASTTVFHVEQGAIVQAK